MAQAKLVSTEPEHREGFVECGWGDIDQPGSYVEVGSGDLYRIPMEALLHGSSPLIRKESAGASRLIRVSKDPYVTTVQARMFCAEHNVTPNF
jgi:hypothetical protein